MIEIDSLENIGFQQKIIIYLNFSVQKSEVIVT